MKEWIELELQKNSDTRKGLYRKESVVEVDELNRGADAKSIVCLKRQDGSTFDIYTMTDYDEIKAALASQADIESVKKIIDELTNDVVMMPNAIGTGGIFFDVGNGFIAMDFLKCFVKQLKERLDEGTDNED